MMDNSEIVTSKQFDEALKTVSDYMVQLKNGISTIVPAIVNVNIQQKISSHVFHVLQLYYKEHLNQILEWENLKAVDLETLKNIDYKILRRYRGFGVIAEIRLKKTINTLSINSHL